MTKKERDPEQAPGTPNRPRRVVKRSPPKRKPMRAFLDFNTCPPELMAASMGNELTPLLSLPPEIRIRIFELVIGDCRCIEIGYACPGQLLPATIPLRQSGEIIIPGPNIKGFYLAHKDDYKVFPHPHTASSHWTSATKVKSRFHPLNRICRQIYHESMTLPYRLHTFAFGNLSALEAWVGSLTPHQKAAVRSIFYADFEPGHVPTIAEITLQELPGLNRIFLPRAFRLKQTVEISQWLDALRQKNLKLIFLERPDGICNYVKVSK